MRHTPRRRGHDGGFTLIELMIVVAVATLLLTIALPAYQESTRKARRAEAVAGLTQLAQAQERHRANNPNYAAAFADFSPQPASETPHYTLGIASAAAGSYSLTATAKNASPQYADTSCRVLSLAASAGALVYQSTDAGGTVDTTNARRCWAR
ncbi:MAG: type IV pilin protein [Burkholderiaceae bacterium]